MELREKTKYVLGLPGGTQIGLEHGKKLPKDYDRQPADSPPPGGFDRGQRFNGFFLRLPLASLKMKSIFSLFINNDRNETSVTPDSSSYLRLQQYINCMKIGLSFLIASINISWDFLGGLAIALFSFENNFGLVETLGSG